MGPTGGLIHLRGADRPVCEALIGFLLDELVRVNRMPRKPLNIDFTIGLLSYLKATQRFLFLILFH